MTRLRSAFVVMLVLFVAVLCGIGQQKGLPYAMFVACELLTLPISLTGCGIVTGASILQVRRTHMSLTALGPLLSRYLLHEAGVRKDVGAKAITESLLPAVGLHALIGPTVFAFKTSQMPPAQVAEILGYPPETFGLSWLRMSARSMGIRTHFIDKALEEFLPAVDQFVVLGAGFDTRAYRQNYAGLKVFEVDTNRTQPMKKRMLASAPLNTTGVTFVEVDFNTDDWLAKLTASGFQTSKRSFFLWEGVTMYLTADIVNLTLKKMTRCGSGSILVFDYLSSDTVNKQSLFYCVIRRLFEWIGEPLLFGIDMDPPAESHALPWLKEAGLRMIRHVTAIPELYSLLAATLP
mmetsp:Transcript_17723/g.31618  ORF Transcript_17723/g.31618 Transcript_17723/m.31618 type:complete len:349 (+) Transcript_17723:54-1100(+)